LDVLLGNSIILAIHRMTIGWGSWTPYFLDDKVTVLPFSFPTSVPDLVTNSYPFTLISFFPQRHRFRLCNPKDLRITQLRAKIEKWKTTFIYFIEGIAGILGTMEVLQENKGVHMQWPLEFRSLLIEWQKFNSPKNLIRNDKSILVHEHPNIKSAAIC